MIVMIVMIVMTGDVSPVAMFGYNILGYSFNFHDMNIFQQICFIFLDGCSGYFNEQFGLSSDRNHDRD